MICCDNHENRKFTVQYDDNIVNASLKAIDQSMVTDREVLIEENKFNPSDLTFQPFQSQSSSSSLQ